MLRDGKCSKGTVDVEEEEEQDEKEEDVSLCRPDDPLTDYAPCLNNDLSGD